ncbi:MAG: TetR/AcrR family transcriptional regulator [Actinobacteria bacterium]|nr:TetR/AcrR family transcriptional regulator [Actinomycetota bacterium]
MPDDRRIDASRSGTGLMASLPHTKATLDDWIDAALRALTDQPIDKLKVLVLADTLGVARSSFYWYFSDRDEFLQALLDIWEHNTTSIVERSGRAAASVAAACLGVFECWADERLYNPVLDLAVRDWGRRDRAIAARVQSADDQRLGALTEMFARHGFNDAEALVRARLLYHSQVGYYAAGTAESLATRLAYLPTYLHAMTGTDATADELAAFTAFVSR